MSRLIKSFFFLFLSTGVLLSAEANEIDGLVGIGYDFGGETLGRVQFDNGDSDSIKSHEGFIFFGGFDYLMSETIKLRGTVGYKFDDVSASNGDASFSRIPIELILFSSAAEHHFGGGLMYHTSVEYECKISGVCDFTIPLEDALGWLVQYEYVIDLPRNNSQMMIGVRYSAIDYKAEAGGESVNASGIGLNVGLIF